MQPVLTTVERFCLEANRLGPKRIKVTTTRTPKSLESTWQNPGVGITDKYTKPACLTTRRLVEDQEHPGYVRVVAEDGSS